MSLPIRRLRCSNQGTYLCLLSSESNRAGNGLDSKQGVCNKCRWMRAIDCLFSHRVEIEKVVRPESFRGGLTRRPFDSSVPFQRWRLIYVSSRYALASLRAQHYLLRSRDVPGRPINSDIVAERRGGMGECHPQSLQDPPIGRRQRTSILSPST